MNKVQILNSVISGLMEVPLPKDGKSIGISDFKIDIRKAYILARAVQFSENIEEMRENHDKFRKFINSIR